MTADQLRKCREAFMEWFRTTSPQTLDFTIQSTIREFAYQAWKDATIKANTRPTAVASHAEGEVVAYRTAWQRKPWPEIWHYRDFTQEAFDDAVARGFRPEKLYTHPPRSGDEARDAARYRRLRENWLDSDEIDLHGRLAVIDAKVDLLINKAAMAARGEDK